MEQKATQEAASTCLLTETLSNIWQNYLNANDDSEAKLHWMELFLFYFQFVDEDALQSEAIKRLLQKIPEEITSFFLETVYDIINKSSLLIPVPANQIGNGEEIHSIIDQPLPVKQNFTPLILNASSDWSKIIALRSFLTHRLGNSLLRFLLRVANKFIASQRSLCNLCINLYPNCTWNLEDIELEPPPSTFTIIASLSTVQRTSSRQYCFGDTASIKTQRNETPSAAQFEDAFKLFENNVTSSDEIAYLLIQLLAKFVANECEDNLNEQSVSVMALNFALECLCSDDEVYKSKRNAMTIKFQLLQLVIRCFNNIFAVSSNVGVMQFQNIFAQISIILQKHSIDFKMDTLERSNATTLHIRDYSSSTAEFLGAMNYILFYVLQNFVTYNLNKLKRPNNTSNNKSSLYDLKLINANVMDISITTFKQLLHYLQTDTDADGTTRILIAMAYRALFKIIDELNKYDQLTTTSSFISSHGHTNLRQRCRYSRQVHCHIPVPTLSCFFQGIFLKLLPEMFVDLQEYAVQYLLRVGICCCHYTLSTYGACLDIIRRLSPKYQKCTYKFLHRRVLSTVFRQQHVRSNKRQQENCAKCDSKLRSLEFRKKILQLYKQIHKILLHTTNEENGCDMTGLQLLLKHLKNISEIFTSDIATGILAEIVLPTFRRFKTRIMQSKCANNVLNSHISRATAKRMSAQLPRLNLHIASCSENETGTSDTITISSGILQDCLAIFVAYLRVDVRLIKAFYNEENISHLEDLFCVSALIRSICDLIKIGIDNMTFLGENSQEQAILSQHLIELQLKSSEHAAFEFNALLNRTNSINKNDSTELVDSLYATVLQWSINYELLQTSQCFVNEFSKMYNLNKHIETFTDNDDIKQCQTLGREGYKVAELHSANSLSGDKTIVDILTLNYNALCVFLQLSQRKTSTQASASKSAHQQQHFSASASPSMQRRGVVVPEVNKQNDCLSSSLESLLSSIEVASVQQSFDSISSSIASTATTIAVSTKSPPEIAGLSSNRHRLQAEPECYVQAVNGSFLNNIRHNQQKQLDCLKPSLTQSIVIFDARNQSNTRAAQNLTLPAAEATLQPSTVGRVATAAALSCAADALSSTSTLSVGPETHAAVLQSDTGIIGKLFSVFGSFFATYNTNSVVSLNDSLNEQSSESNIQPILLGLLESSGDCKRYLLRLFEVTMAICIRSLQNDTAKNMQTHLLKLKAVILNSANSYRNAPHTDDTTRENAIIKALQTLLKIAELSPSNATNVPGMNLNSSTAGENSASEDMTLPSPLRPRARSFNSAKAHAKKINEASPHTTAGESCDADYFSTRPSLFCDSEMELSENENDDYYITADEGYEADAEIPELSDSAAEIDKSVFWNSFQPSSRYRTHLLHDGLCQLVVEILIELSERCILNPVCWCDSLVQLTNRLFVIREYIGGSLFLLRGFAPVLKCGDPRLRELQQALLELIMDMNTPEIMCTYFNILAAKNPPVDLLIKYMHHINGNQLKKPQPIVELEFPILIDGKCTSTSDARLTMEIDRVRNQHIDMQAMTPISRSPCIIPITHARLWGNDGFTLSFWLQMKGSHNRKFLSQSMEEETRSSTDDNLKTHIISVGTNQVMLSAYVDSNMRLVFETCKPNAEIQTQLQTPPSEATNADLVAKSPQSPMKNALNPNSNDCNITNRKATTSWNVPTNPASNSSTFRVALKQTKMVILNSFNNMHLFNYNNQSQSYYESTPVDLKLFRFVKNRWTHVAFGVCTHPDHIELTVYIDGVEQDIVNLRSRNIRGLIRNHAFQVICLGDSTLPTKNTNNTNNTESRSTIDGYPMRFSISNLLLFNSKFVAGEVIANLTAMGPDFSELAPLQVSSWRPNYGYINLSKLKKPNFGSVAECMRLLHEARMLTYTAESPDIVMGYNNDINTKDGNLMCAGRVYGLILYGELIQNHLQSIPTATLLCGGLSTHLYLFARIVELSSNSMSQYMALDFLLSVALSNSELYGEFLRNNYMNLIGYVIKTDRCTKDVNLLRSIMNNACSQPVISTKCDSFDISENTAAIVIYPQLIVMVLHRYSDWHRSGVEHSEVLDTYFLSILALTREKHPYRDFNLEQLSEAGLLKELLNLCKVYVIESPNPVYISKSAAESFVAILSAFAGSPPSSSLMDEVMKLTLLLQKPSECYITHDRSKFYFLLIPQAPVKERSAAGANFNRVATPFRRSYKRERPGGVVAAALDNADVNSKQTERIKRLRRLHLSNSNSPLKRSLLEFEENLENIADCGRLNKNALRSLSPVDVVQWRTKFKYHCNYNTPTTTVRKCNSNKQIQSPLSVPQKISHKRLRGSGRHSTRLHKYSNFGKRAIQPSVSSASHFGYDSAAKGNECPTTMPISAQHRGSKLPIKTDFYNSLGIIALQEGLFTLLRNFLCLMPDNSVDEVLKHYIKVDILLVLSNNSSCAVRTAIIKLLAILLKRLQQSDILQHIKNLYPQHLANQMSIYPTNMAMFEACLEWVTGIFSDTATILTCDTTLHVLDRFGINTLLAIVTNMASEHRTQQTKAFIILRKMYETEVDQRQLFIEDGLLQCCIKSLNNLYLGPGVMDTELENAILTLLTRIGEISLKSVGHINVLWDILNMLSFLRECRCVSAIKNLRSAQARLQLKWIGMFFGPSTEPKLFKVIPLPDSTLTLTETKTRLELLIDRCTQFFTTCDVNYTPSAPEVQLFELLVSYSIFTSQRCNNFIAWGLQPSRPRELRTFIINALWSACQDELLPSVICDGKMIKSFLWLCLLEDLEKPLDNLERLCKLLGINEHDSTWNLESQLEHIKLSHCTLTAKQKSMLDKTVYKLEPLAVSCIESSMLTTRRVAELQNAERKLLMCQLKDYDDACIYTKWVGIVRRMTHEGAPWYCKERAENSWELDDTEGPSRVHTRLRRCYLDIDKRFFMEDYNMSALSNTNSYLDTGTSHIYEHARPLEYLLSSYDQQLNISLNSQILYNFPAKYLPVDGEIDGEIIVTDHKLFFMATYRCKYFYINCDISSISEIWLKRYQHQEKAFEIFLDTNQSLFFSLANQDDYKIIRDLFCDKIVTPPDQTKVLVITQQWRDGLLTNWEYLMTLNQIAGRTYNDLMQYPIFPWILANYKSDKLDLTDSSNFRKLGKPVAVQHEENEQHYINNYMYINNTMTNMGSMTLKPYHYSSHYSNSGTVLHFLVRVPPFTSYFLRYQDNNFDLPDRTFHSLNTTWNLASRDSPTDVKELIPEFFCLPEMFENFERFNFGCRQNGERVEGVQLPPWCLRDARFFVLIHRQALEAELTRSQLHHWIDLIFGYKQSGENAVEAINVFHPATYPSFLASITTDPIERRAVETMIKTYGQMPRQLFKTPHPPSKSLNYCLGIKEVLSSVRGLRWGVYLGSPQLSTPTLGNIYKIPGAEYLVSFHNTNVVYGLPTKSCIMQGAEVDTFNVISWDYDDRIVRIQPLNKTHAKSKNLLRSSINDGITACGADPNSNQLWFGHKSGRISIYKCGNADINNRAVKGRQNYMRGLRLSYNSAFRKLTTKSYTDDGDTGQVAPLLSQNLTTTIATDAQQRDSVSLIWTGPTILLRHTDEVTSIRLSMEFKIAVTAGRDGIAVIWDLNNWNYIRTIDRPVEIHQSPITVVAISPTLGDIVTVHTTPQQLVQNLQQDGRGSHSSIQNKTDVRTTSPIVPDECFEVTEENLDDFVNVCINPNGKSILRLHTVNARYVQHIVHEERILAASYSYIKEGVGVNVIATAIEGGTVRLWSSWNLSFVSEIVTGISNIISVVYSTHQHLVALTKDSHIQVWETEGLYGNSPKFPQIAYK